MSSTPAPRGVSRHVSAAAAVACFLLAPACDLATVEDLDEVDALETLEDEEDALDQAVDAALVSPAPAPLTVQSCDVTYSAPAVFPPIDPVPLLAGQPSDCAVGSNDSPCAPHHVYSPNPTREREPLFVFLPGTNMEPDKHDQVLMTAASTGYRSIGLSYDNTVSGGDACAGLEDCALDCRSLMREEVVRGVDLTPTVDVARGDAVIVRLYRVLEELDAIDPAGGWDAYFVPNKPNPKARHIHWEDIILGGFSQGASTAAFISRQEQVHGLFLLDGANGTCEDAVLGEVPAGWMTSGTDASAGRPKYGVRHDHGTGDTTNTASWETIGLGTSLANLDCVAFCDVMDSIPPSVAAKAGHGFPASPSICSNHMSMARDECMPTDVSGTTAAILPEDARLFEVYARRLCYACDAATCP